MWITKEMAKDFEDNVTWIPWAGNFIETLEYVSDALAGAGYVIEIKKI